ncbi:MAG: DEAD/DEAH box helicase [Solibacillus sp.]
MLQKPFSQTISINLHETQQGYYTLTAENESGGILPAEQWAPSLFFNYAPNFFGMQLNLQEDALTLPLAELLDVLSPPYRHPFIELAPANEASTKVFNGIQEARAKWSDAALWEQATFHEQGFTLGNELLTTAAQQKLALAGIQQEDIQTLVPFFKNGGWPLQQKRMSGAVKLSLRLSEPAEDEEQWLLETGLTSASSAKLWTPAVKKRALPIAEALPEKWKQEAANLVQVQQQMLTILDPELMRTQPEGAFIYTELTDAQVRQFLQHDLSKLQALGFDMILPAWLKELKQSKMRVQVSAGNTSTKAVAGLQDILSFNWQFSMNDEEISAEQFKRLVEEKREFVRVGNEWFRMDANWLQQMRELMEQAEEENWTVRDLLFRELPETLPISLDEESAEEDPLFVFDMQQSLKNYITQLQDKKGLPAVETPTTLQAELRPYQQQGFEWLSFMREQQFGACLADDMGLGKTIQLITYILSTVATTEHDKPTLIVCPTSVVGNWQKEIARFAPSLNVHTHYGSKRLKEDELLQFIKQEKPHILLSTYGMVTQDVDTLERIDWSIVALDEAQNIKNIHTQQSRSVRRLRGEHHIALTGTPVENRLSELWAIFDFIHKGYLGSFTKFQEQFILPIERDDSEVKKRILRAKIQPFLLRRTKRDPELMLNLPEKQETHEFCPLSTEQAALYEGYIADTLAQIEELSGFEKKGRILKMLGKLKQLCNHPALYLKEPFEDAETMLTRSVKVKRIVELAATIVDAGDRCLIFTQYIGMGNLLQHCFSELYQLDVPFLTGSMTKQQRDDLVEAFQAGEFPIFILSLKAGGTGLNLTAANHVLHADRWWNPAVENQATDRAYRIGQTQFVQVHKFVTIGTIEEKINKIIEMKSALSEELIQSSKWLTELTDEELSDLLTLDAIH